eukprot:TRINITY_DN9381_c0_g1_i5.p1 TRINITY_DN9381_c0_g1~~TRINITY_DN9381_c0_g1_i5.p1  ORF type:complete len:525 (+),score=108.79 TRINITY_DN9381_c0_g1_i5:192-1577(+)
MAAETNAAFTGSGDLGQPSISRKRKRLSSHITDHTPRGSNGDLDATHTMAPIQVQIGALQALEALLTVGGSLRSDRWRADVDSLLITVAMNISASSSLVAGCYSEHMADRFEEGMSYTISDVQIAAYKAVLASLLSPCYHRPPYLSQALSLFRRGKQESGTELAEFCAHALLALEPFMHPRSQPYASIPRSTSVGGNQASSAFHCQKSMLYFENSDGGRSVPEASGNLPFGDGLSQDDDIYLGWLANGDDPNTDQDHLGCNPEIPIDSLVGTLTENDGLQCRALDEITNMTSLQSHINDATTVPPVSIGNTSSTSNEKNLPTGPLQTQRSNAIDVLDSGPHKIGQSEDSSGKQLSEIRVADHELNAESESEYSEKLLPSQLNADPGIQKNHDNVEPVIAIRKEKTDPEPVKSSVDVSQTVLEASTQSQTEDQVQKDSFIASTVNCDSDDIPEIVDCDPDTE